jgi:hypothetical protein
MICLKMDAIGVLGIWEAADDWNGLFCESTKRAALLGVTNVSVLVLEELP